MLYEVITGIHVNQKVVAQFLHLFAVDPPPSGKQSLNLDAWQEAIHFLSWHNGWNVCTRRGIAESRNREPIPRNPRRPTFVLAGLTGWLARELEVF